MGYLPFTMSTAGMFVLDKCMRLLWIDSWFFYVLRTGNFQPNWNKEIRPTPEEQFKVATILDYNVLS